MDTPALKFHTSKGKWKQDVFQDSAEQLQALLFLSRTLRSSGILLSTPTKTQVKADILSDKGAKPSLLYELPNCGVWSESVLENDVF